MKEIIRTEKLCKHFGRVKAVDGVSISIRKGEIYGFLGLNGAGKTTTIRMLLGMIKPTSGSAFIHGRKVSSRNPDLWQNLGYLVEVPYSYPELTVVENLELIRRLRYLKSRDSVDKIIDKLELGPYRDIPSRNLSLGNSQRLGLAKAMIHNPDILLLDEPANGLDPAGIAEIRNMLKDMALNKGVTIFISSHILGEISRFATRIGIIHEGHLILESDFLELEKKRIKKVLVKTRDKERTGNLLREKGYDVKLSDSTIVEIHDQRAIDNPEIISALLVNENLPPTLLMVDEEDLESFFLRVTGTKGGSL
jgi:ABC-2 type transport system ATP-binding protein